MANGVLASGAGELSIEGSALQWFAAFFVVHRW
jgi:hypothetical protein